MVVYEERAYYQGYGSCHTTRFGETVGYAGVCSYWLSAFRKVNRGLYVNI
ncbi:MAG: hypothetical protein JRI45_10125 [Deltaproteobacteria bacterium]|nr:hypothetical protein [Deltaproteobacteria bacterium]